MSNEISNTLALIAGIGMLLFGGGGVAAYIKQRRDSKSGVRQDNRADGDSLNARAIAIVESQFNFLVKPLQEKVTGLEESVTKLQLEIESTKSKYWKAVTHIRTLYAWIAKHMPADVETTIVPPPPVELAEDI